MRSAPLAAAAAAALLLLASGTAIAPLAAQESAEAPKTLTPGTGADLTMARCSICHDITHVTRTRLSRGEWEYNVKNMIERGMPIAADEIPRVVDYLATYYNRDSAAPPPDPAADAAAAGQDPVQRLLINNACTACHGIEQKIVGPSFKQVAARYAGDGDAGTKLAAKIKAGGSGAWGPVPMPPQPALSAAELQEMVSWILSRK